jgi:hypothetical protein
MGTEYLLVILYEASNVHFPNFYFEKFQTYRKVKIMML